MARRARKAAPGRGGRPRRRGTPRIPWLALALGAVAALAVVGLWRMAGPASRPPESSSSSPLLRDDGPADDATDAPAPRDRGALRETGGGPARAGVPDDATVPGSSPSQGPAWTGRDQAPAPASAAPLTRPAIALGASAGRNHGLPRVAIVLDDCGQRLDLLERAIRLRQPLTLAVLPHLPHSEASARKAFAAGHEVIVHQPMEPEGGEDDPGAGVLRAGLSPPDIARTLRESFASVPHAVGLNNHMGSKATADAALMASVLGALAAMQDKRPLYFLDSRTSAQTVAREAARQAGLRTAQRDVFLDNELDAPAILGQFRRLMDEAAEQGEAIGIGHLKPETLAVLETAMPEAEGREVQFVFLGDLMR